MLQTGCEENGPFAAVWYVYELPANLRKSDSAALNVESHYAALCLYIPPLPFAELSPQKTNNQSINYSWLFTSHAEKFLQKRQDTFLSEPMAILCRVLTLMAFMPGLWAASITSFTLNTAEEFETVNCAIQFETDFTTGTGRLNGCDQTIDGTTAIESAQFHIYCDNNRSKPSGQYECAGIRHVCATIPLGGTSCVEVQLIGDNTACNIPDICTSDCLQCEQENGSNLPLAFSFTGAS